MTRMAAEEHEPFRAEVHVSPDDWNLEELYQPQIGDVRGFVFNPATGETRFDMTDGRNSWRCRTPRATP
jgi:hypothetical protein